MALTEVQQLLKALEEEGYVLARVARALGVTNATVANRVRKHKLDELVESKNARLRAHRINRLYPPAPHEPSRQAQEQKRNREQGLCSCGKPTEPFQSGREAKSCKGCRERDRIRKSGASKPAA